MDRMEKSLDNHRKGYNCCQAIVCAYSDAVGIDEETLFRISEGFGAGMGGMKATCGAVSAAILLAGLKQSAGKIATPMSKGETYRLSKKIVDMFQEKNGSIICQELKGIKTGKILRSCDGCIEDAVQIIEKLLN